MIRAITTVMRQALENDELLNYIIIIALSHVCTIDGVLKMEFIVAVTNADGFCPPNHKNTFCFCSKMTVKSSDFNSEISQLALSAYQPGLIRLYKWRVREKQSVPL